MAADGRCNTPGLEVGGAGLVLAASPGTVCGSPSAPPPPPPPLAGPDSCSKRQEHTVSQ